MCWIYNCKGGNCHVCTRLREAQGRAAVDIIAQKDPEPKYAKGYASTVKLPETTRVSRNEYVKAAIFKTHKPIVAPRAERTTAACMIGGNEVWDLLRKKRRLSAGPIAKAAAAAIEKAASDETVPLGVSRLFRFLAVLQIIGTAPWANVKFKENEQMLLKIIATHLILIVGKEEYARHRATLLSIIDSKTDLSKLVHLTWITNRQNGKTTTLAKFLAAMAIMSPAGGPLIYVYSTTRDRAIELIDGAKRYIDWILQEKPVRDAVEALGLTITTYSLNNTIGFSIPSFVDPTVVNTVKARPKTADSCRGDAPRACMFDEVGFVSADFWFRFAYPLIQVGERVFLMATTPAHSGTFFAAFTDAIQAAQAKGNHNFSLINHSVICDECLQNGIGDRCCHKLNMIPSWKSVLQFNAMKALVPSKRVDDFQKEVFGVIKADSTNYLPNAWVNELFSESNMKPLIDVDVKITVYIGIDPPSHGSSYMGCAAIVYTTKGQVYLVGTAEVSIKESEMIQLKSTAGRFVIRVIEQLKSPRRPYSAITVVPIVECNNNEFQSNDLVSTVVQTTRSLGCSYSMPFTKAFFKKSISEFIGVWTGAVEKLGGLQSVVTLMQDRRIVVWDRCVTIGAVHLKRITMPKIGDALLTLRTGLCEFKETANGPSGKTSSNNDDSAMAFILSVYWSHCVRATQMFDNA